MEFIKKTDGHLLRGIELSDVATPRTRGTGASSPQANNAAHAQSIDQVEHGTLPSITVKKGWTRKQKLAGGGLVVTGVGLLAATSALAGVQFNKNNSLQRKINLLDNNLAEAGATNTLLRSQLAQNTAAPSVTVSAPPPPEAAAPAPAHSVDELRDMFSSPETTLPLSLVQQVAGAWNLSDPAVDTTPEESLQYGNLSYVDLGLTLFPSSNLPSFNDIRLNGGIPAAHAIEGNFGLETEMSEALGAAAGAIVVADPVFVQSMYNNVTTSGTSSVEMPLNIQTRVNPFGFSSLVLPVLPTVLTDNNLYVRGTNALRVLEGSLEAGLSPMQPTAVSWFPLLQKQAIKISQVLNERGYYLELNTVDGAMQAMTGQPVESRDLTRVNDWEIQSELDSGGSDAGLLFGVLQGLPSTTFDESIGNLVANPQRAAAFMMRNGFGLAYLPNGTANSASWDGLFLEPALGGAHLHVKSSDGSLNEIFFADRPYVFVGSAYNETTGDLALITLADMSGATIDCDAYDQSMASYKNNTGLTDDLAVYGNNATLIEQQLDVSGQPAIWATLPIKSAMVNLPYDVFKKLAVWSYQVNVPLVTEANNPVETPDAAPFIG